MESDFKNELQVAIVKLQKRLEQVVKLQIKHDSPELIKIRNSLVKIQSELMETIIKESSNDV